MVKLLETARNCSKLLETAPTPNGSLPAHPALPMALQAAMRIQASLLYSYALLEGRIFHVFRGARSDDLSGAPSKTTLSPKRQVARKGGMRAWRHLRGGALGGGDVEADSV